MLFPLETVPWETSCVGYKTNKFPILGYSLLWSTFKSKVFCLSLLNIIKVSLRTLKQGWQLWAWPCFSLAPSLHRNWSTWILQPGTLLWGTWVRNCSFMHGHTQTHEFWGHCPWLWLAGSLWLEGEGGQWLLQLEKARRAWSAVSILLTYGFLGFFPSEWSKEHDFCHAGTSVKPKLKYLISNWSFCVIVCKVVSHLTGGTQGVGQPGLISPLSETMEKITTVSLEWQVSLCVGCLWRYRTPYASKWVLTYRAEQLITISGLYIYHWASILWR